MSQLDEISKLYAKPKKYKIPLNPKEGEEQAEVELIPLTLKQLTEVDMNEKDDEKTTQKKLMKMLEYSLNVPEEEITKISVSHMEDLMNCMMEANNISEDKRKKVTSMVKRRNKAIAEAQNESTGKTE